MNNIIVKLNNFYDFWLENKTFQKVFKISIFFLCLITLFNNLFLGIIFFIIRFFWLNYFTFPFKKRKQTNIVMGPPGSGKTTFAAFISKWCKQQNEPCFSNIPLFDTYKFIWSQDFGTNLIENSTLIIDEAALESGLNNRDFKTNFKDSNFRRLETLKLHRHFGLDLWFFSQWDDIDLKVRELSQQYYVLKKTPFSWLVKIKMYVTDIDLDPMTQDFRKVRIKKHTYFLFSPVVWCAFDTEEVPFTLAEKDFTLRCKS